MNATDIETTDTPLRLVELHKLGLRSGGTPEELALLCQPSPEDQTLQDRVRAATATLAELPAKMAAHGERIASLPPLLVQLDADLAQLKANNERMSAGLDEIGAASDAPEPQVEKILVDPPEAARMLSLNTVKALYSRVARGQIPASAIYRTGSRIQFIVAELKKLKPKRGAR